MSIEMTASLFCSYANEEKPVRRVSRRKDEEGCGTGEGCRHGGGCGCCGGGFVASFKLCRTRGSRFSSSVLCRTSKILARRVVYFWWNYAKGIVKTSEEGRWLTPIYDASDINAPVNINAMYTRHALTFFH